MKIAVSGCLLGKNIRYDGTNKKDKFIVNELSRYSEYVAFCPEHIAYGTPRETIRLVDEDDDTKVYTVNSTNEVTQELKDSIKKEINRLKEEDLSGIILKAKSPSCGLGSTKLYKNGMPEGKHDGLFAQACKENFEYLPIEEEARLNDAWLRENFAMQIFAYNNMKNITKSIAKYNDLVDFHTSYKYLLHSKSEDEYRELGRIVANHDKKDLTQVVSEYEKLFYKTIAYKSSIKKTANVLEHMLGFFKNDISGDEKKHIKILISQYKEKIIPLITVMEMFKLLSNKYKKEFLLAQKFLDPYPSELALRSDIKAGK